MFSTAMLEKLVHADAVMPLYQHYIRITIPDGTRYETFQAADHPGWNGKRETVCKCFGQI